MLFRNLSPIPKCKKDGVSPLILNCAELAKKFPELGVALGVSIRQSGLASATVLCPICKAGATMVGHTQRIATQCALDEWEYMQDI